MRRSAVSSASPRRVRTRSRPDSCNLGRADRRASQICQLSSAIFWKSGLAVLCSGKSTTICNSSTDPGFQGYTRALDSLGGYLDAAALAVRRSVGAFAELRLGGSRSQDGQRRGRRLQRPSRVRHPRRGRRSGHHRRGFVRDGRFARYESESDHGRYDERRHLRRVSRRLASPRTKITTRRCVSVKWRSRRSSKRGSDARRRMIRRAIHDKRMRGTSSTSGAPTSADSATRSRAFMSGGSSTKKRWGPPESATPRARSASRNSATPPRKSSV